MKLSFIHFSDFSNTHARIRAPNWAPGPCVHTAFVKSGAVKCFVIATLSHVSKMASTGSNEITIYTDTNRVLKMRTQHHFLPELRHWLSGTKCGHATFMWMAFFGHYFYSGTHLVVHQRCFLYSPLLTWVFVFSPPPSLTFFISSRNVSESTIHFLRRHKRKILIRIDTSTVYSTFDWDQFN